jgi:hypothetical protein
MPLLTIQEIRSAADIDHDIDLLRLYSRIHTGTAYCANLKVTIIETSILTRFLTRFSELIKLEIITFFTYAQMKLSPTSQHFLFCATPSFQLSNSINSSRLYLVGGRKEPVPIITGRMDEGGIRRDDMALLLGQRV